MLNLMMLKCEMLSDFHRTPRSTTSLTTPDSSQTESDVSPTVIRRKKPGMKDVIPRFSISVEDEVQIFSQSKGMCPAA